MTNRKYIHADGTSFEPFGQRSVHYGNYKIVDEQRRVGRGKKVKIKVYNPETGRMLEMIFKANGNQYISRMTGISVENLQKYKSWDETRKPSDFSYVKENKQ